MNICRKKEREVLLILVYSVITWDLEFIDDFYDTISECVGVNKVYIKNSYQKMLFMKKSILKIDEYISNFVDSINICKIRKLELSVLRVAVFELLNKLPKNIVISESIRLINKFGTKESISFINAVLDDLSSYIDNEV